MGLIVIGSLVLKRAQEKPKRKWRVWTGDVGKQVSAPDHTTERARKSAAPRCMSSRLWGTSY